MQVGDKIKAIRQEQRISQEKLATHLNVSRQAVSRWENNLSLPDLNTLILISRYLDIPLEYFADDNIASPADLPQMSTASIQSDPPKPTRDQIIKKAEPYILVLAATLGVALTLPSKIKVPILFFGTIFIIFMMLCMVIYYIIKNYLSQS